MKPWIILLSGVLLLGSVHAGEWSHLSIRSSASKRDLTIFCGKERKGSVRDFQKSGLVTLSEQNGMLLLNTEKFRRTFPGKSLDFYYFLSSPNP